MNILKLPKIFHIFLIIIIIGFVIFLLGGGMSLISALQTNKASGDQVYFILTTPTFILYLIMLTLSGWMFFIDAPQRWQTKIRYSKIEAILGLILLLASWFSIEMLFMGIRL
jgi:hypothetical protein